MSTQSGPVVVSPVAGRRRAHLAVAAWLAVILAVVAWVGAARIGSSPTTPGLAAPGSASPSSPGSAASSRPAPSGPVQVVEGPPPSGTVWMRTGSGVRSLDLWNGERGAPVGTGDWEDRILRLPGGQFICVCTDVTAIEGGQRVTMSLTNIDTGMVSKSAELATVEGVRDSRVPTDQQPYPVQTMATLSPDGSLVGIGVSARKETGWERSVLFVDTGSRAVVHTVRLDPVPADRHVEAWAPRIQFSSDGRRALIGLTIYKLGTVTDERHFVAGGDGGFSSLTRVDGFGTTGTRGGESCIDSWPQLLGDATVFGICRDANGFRPVLRSVSLESGRALELDLDPVLKGVYPMQLVDESRGLLYLWDPFSHRAARIHIASAKLDSATTVETPTAALLPLEHVARAFSAWVAPAAAAKILLEPGLALSPDGKRLYVVAMSGDGFTDPGEASMIHVLDAGTLQKRATWEVDPDVVSIAIAPNGRDVVVGLLPRAPEGVSPTAALAVIDGETGAVRARYDDLGQDWPLLVDAAALNR